MFSPSTSPVFPDTKTDASTSLAAASTETDAVKAGTTSVDPSTTGKPLMLKIFNVLSLEGGVTNRSTL